MIEIDTRTFREVEKTLGRYKSKTPTALSRALNRAISTTRTVAAKKTREEYYLKSKDIKDTMETVKASRSNLGALVVSKGERLGLDNFRFKPKKPRPKNPPTLQVAVKRDGYKKLKSAFVTDINENGKPLIFERVGKSRLPIKRMYGPAIPQMLGNEETKEFAYDQAADTFHKRLDHEVKRVLERGR